MLRPRSATGRPRHAWNARSASATAAATWSGVNGSNEARTSSVAGLSETMRAAVVAMGSIEDRTLRVRERIHGLHHRHLDAGGGLLEALAVAGHADPREESVVHRHRELRLHGLHERRGLFDGHHETAVSDRHERDVSVDPLELGQAVSVARVVIGPAGELDHVP